MAIPNTTYYESMVLTNPVVREAIVDANGPVHAPTTPGIGYEERWQGERPWERGMPRFA